MYEGPDEVAPDLEAFSMAPSTFDTQEKTVLVQIDAGVSDGLSGVGSVWVELVPPGWTEGDGEGRYVELRDLLSGDSHRGTWTASFRFPLHSSPGTYRVNRLILRDQANNSSEYDGAKLEALGLPAGLEQTGPGDTTPPEIADLSILTPTLHTEQGENVLMVDVQVKDDLSGAGVLGDGFARMDLRFEGVGVPYPGSGQGSPTPVSGYTLDGVWRHEVSISRQAAAGEYRVSQVEATDRAGNRTLLKGAQLEAKGWDLNFINAP